MAGLTPRSLANLVINESIGDWNVYFHLYFMYQVQLSESAYIVENIIFMSSTALHIHQKSAEKGQYISLYPRIRSSKMGNKIKITFKRKLSLLLQYFSSSKCSFYFASGIHSYSLV